MAAMNTIWTILKEFWQVLGEMSPYLLFGFFMAGVLSIFISARTVERYLGKRGMWSVVKASFWGVPLPLCSCSVIPVATSLRKHGSSKGATTAFLLSTPQTGVDSIFVTLSLLGPVFAIFRPLAAFVTGLFGGGLVDAFDARNGSPEGQNGNRCEDECCVPVVKTNRFVRALRYGFVTLPRDIGKELLIGLLVAGVITALVPDDFFADVLGTGFLAMLVMMALGIPVYVCATASVPVAAALIMKGVTPGAAFVFLMTGPATNAASIITLRKLLGTRAAVIYLLTVAFTALAWGLLLDQLFQVANIPAVHAAHWMMPGYVKVAGAVILLVVLGVAVLRKPGPAPAKQNDSGGKKDEACCCHK